MLLIDRPGLPRHPRDGGGDPQRRRRGGRHTYVSNRQNLHLTVALFERSVVTTLQAPDALDVVVVQSGESLIKQAPATDLVQDECPCHSSRFSGTEQKTTPPTRPKATEATMNPLTFSDFESAAKSEGFDEVLLETHSHSFAVKALVAQGEFWLTCGPDSRHLRAGEAFELACDVPHAERYGSNGATLWVARRHAQAIKPE